MPEKTNEEVIYEAIKKVEDKLDALIDRLGEFSDQIEEAIVRIEDAHQDDYR